MDRTDARRLLTTYVETPVARALARLGIGPNVITLAGLVGACGSAYLLGTGSLAWGGVVLLAAGVLDLFDGAVARLTGRASKFGALLDSTADRVSEAVVLLGLLVFYMGEASTLGAALAFAAMVGSMMVSYVRARAEGLGVHWTGGVMTRPERVAVLGAATIAGEWWGPAVIVALGVIAALTTLTTLQRVFYVRRVLAEEEAEEYGGQP